MPVGRDGEQSGPSAVPAGLLHLRVPRRQPGERLDDDFGVRRLSVGVPVDRVFPGADERGVAGVGPE